MSVWSVYALWLLPDPLVLLIQLAQWNIVLFRTLAAVNDPIAAHASLSLSVTHYGLASFREPRAQRMEKGHVSVAI